MNGFCKNWKWLVFCYQNFNLHSVCNEFYTHFLSLTAMCFEYSGDCNEFYTHFLSHTAPKDETRVCVHICGYKVMLILVFKLKKIYITMSLSACFVNMNLTGYATEVKYIVTKDKFI